MSPFLTGIFLFWRYFCCLIIYGMIINKNVSQWANESQDAILKSSWTFCSGVYGAVVALTKYIMLQVTGDKSKSSGELLCKCQEISQCAWKLIALLPTFSGSGLEWLDRCTTYADRSIFAAVAKQKKWNWKTRNYTVFQKTSTFLF